MGAWAQLEACLSACCLSSRPSRPSRQVTFPDAGGLACPCRSAVGRTHGGADRSSDVHADFSARATMCTHALTRGRALLTVSRRDGIVSRTRAGRAKRISILRHAYTTSLSHYHGGCRLCCCRCPRVLDAGSACASVPAPRDICRHRKRGQSCELLSTSRPRHARMRRRHVMRKCGGVSYVSSPWTDPWPHARLEQVFFWARPENSFRALKVRLRSLLPGE